MGRMREDAPALPPNFLGEWRKVFRYEILRQELRKTALAVVTFPLQQL
jgi:hypothetical protein